MSWTPEQQRMLQVMGYQLFVRIGDAEAAPDAIGTEATLSALRAALQRAAGTDKISSVVNDLAALRGNARLKRALWPRLRQLRRLH